YEIIKEKHIASPSLTGDWEMKMSHIQKGALTFSEFISEVREFSRFITSELLSVTTSIKSQRDEKNENMPQCPKCKKQKLRAFEKGIGCNKECGFVVWNTVAGKKITETQLLTLITKGVSPVIKGFKNKAGKEFSTKLQLNKEFKIEFLFDNKK
ncbi:MAG: topoisomerase C-terminal repeat-containing protein, partial [Bacteroidales bacterium]